MSTELLVHFPVERAQELPSEELQKKLSHGWGCGLGFRVQGFGVPLNVWSPGFRGLRFRVAGFGIDGQTDDEGSESRCRP